MPRDFEMIRIYNISDVHRGNPLHDEESWHAYLKQIASDPFGYAVVNGDGVEAALKSSKLGDTYRSMSPQEERKILCEELASIRDKILAITDGNHELRHRDSDESPLGIIAEKLGLEDRYDPVGVGLKVSFGTYEGKKNKPTTYTFYVKHGTGGAKKAGSKLNRALEMKNAMEGVDGYFMGHVHGVISHVQLQPYMDPRNGKFGVRTVAFVIGGAFLKYGGYAETADLPPCAVSQPILECHVKRKSDPYKYMEPRTPAFIRRVA